MSNRVNLALNSLTNSRIDSKLDKSKCMTNTFSEFVSSLILWHASFAFFKSRHAKTIFPPFGIIPHTVRNELNLRTNRSSNSTSLCQIQSGFISDTGVRSRDDYYFTVNTILGLACATDKIELVGQISQKNF